MRTYNVEKHPSGRLTLTCKDEGDAIRRDVPEAVAISDPGKFYRRVAMELAKAHADEIDFEYHDID